MIIEIMRCFIFICFLALFCFGVDALRKRQLQSTHVGKYTNFSKQYNDTISNLSFIYLKGYCPFYPVHCAIYCPPSTIDMILSTTSNGCRKDNECALDEKCCPPACGCTNKCVKALQNPGWPTKSQQ